MLRMITLLLAFSALAGCTMLPDGKQPQKQRGAAQNYASTPGARQCLKELSLTNASFSPVPDRYFENGCATLNSVRLTALRSDSTTLDISNLGPVSCPLANSFAAWARFGVDRAARQILGSGLARIETMGSYSCRNVAGSGRRSAHATANAIDVSGFLLADGRRISVLGGWNGGSPEERRFLKVVHDSACKRFGTVLGPDYNSAHHDHLHVEAGGGSFCR